MRNKRLLAISAIAISASVFMTACSFGGDGKTDKTETVEVTDTPTPEVTMLWRRPFWRQPQGFSQKSEHDRGTILRLKNCELELTWKKHPLSEPGCAGMVIEDTDHSFWIFGCNTGVRLLPPRGTKKSLTLLNMEEGHFENSKWIKGRVLNGDERYRKNLGAYPTVLRFSYQCYEVQPGG